MTSETATTTAGGESSASAPNTPSSNQTEGSLLSGASTTTESSTTTETSTATGSQWVNEKGEFTEGWLDRLPEDLQKSKQMFGQQKDLPSLLKSYEHAQKLLGKQANAVIIPKDDASPEEVAAFRAKLGVPDSVEKYATKIEGLPEGMALDEAGVKQFNELAHKTGLTPSQAQEAVKFYAGIETQRATAAQEAAKAEYAAGQKALGELFGKGYETEIAVTKRGVQLAGGNMESKGFGDPEVIKVVNRLTRMQSDDKIASSDVSSTHMAGKARAMDIATNDQNPLHAKWLKGDAATHALYMDLLANG